MSSYKDKKVLILGLGVNQGGLGTTKFFAKEGAEVLVTDLKTADDLKVSLDELKDFKNITYHLGGHKNEDIDWASLIIRNPAIKPNNEFLEYAKEKNKTVEMDMGIFLEQISPNQIIGVTGTKGKSTTSTLIYQILKTKIPEVIFAGNIGKSMFDCLSLIKPDSLIILELSSFQLQALKQHQVSPKYSLITNIYPDHLNYHSSMKEYTDLKRSIAQYQDKEGIIILRKNDPVTDTEKFKRGLMGKIIYFSAGDLPPDFKPLLPGDHNLDDIAAATALAKQFGVNEETALEVSKKFTGVEFRLELIYNQGEIKIYNDTTATNPSAAAASLKALPNSILIAGGMNKGLDYTEFARAIDQYAKQVYFLAGDATDEIKKLLKDKTKVVGTWDNLLHVVKIVQSKIKPGDTILFSPGATSFNLFQNEFDRGRKFNQAVEKIFKNT